MFLKLTIEHVGSNELKMVHYGTVYHFICHAIVLIMITFLALSLHAIPVTV